MGRQWRVSIRGFDTRNAAHSATQPAGRGKPGRRGEWAGCYAGFCLGPLRKTHEPMDGHLSTTYVAARLQRSTRRHDEQPYRLLSDLAPGEVYLASHVTMAAGGLLHHRFTLTTDSRRSQGGLFSVALFSRVAPGGCYPPPCSAEPGRSSVTAAPVAERRMLEPTRPSCRPIRVPSLPRAAVRAEPSAGDAAHMRAWLDLLRKCSAVLGIVRLALGSR